MEGSADSPSSPSNRHDPQLTSDHLKTRYGAMGDFEQVYSKLEAEEQKYGQQ